jgi:hypothetical protein
MERLGGPPSSGLPGRFSFETGYRASALECVKYGVFGVSRTLTGAACPWPYRCTISTLGPLREPAGCA